MKKYTALFILALTLTAMSGCTEETPMADTSAAESQVTDSAAGEAETTEVAEESQASETESVEEETTEAFVSVATIDYDGSYDTYPEVALYLHTYDELPQNYMTKKEAQALGWSGGSLEDYAPGMCIGGSYFGNNEGFLPEEDSYTECDIETLGKSKRGAKRIVFSDDGDIYYTSDHYESFHLLYTAEGEVEECIIYDADGAHEGTCTEDHSSQLAQ